MEEDLAQQRRRLDAALAHAHRIRLVSFGLEELKNQGEQDLAEDRCPFLVIGGAQLRG